MYERKKGIKKPVVQKYRNYLLKSFIYPNTSENRETMRKITKMKKKILAIPAAPLAILVKPKTPAITAMMIKIMV